MKMIRHSLLIIFIVCAVSTYPATSISRWFTSTYHDMQVTFRRYSHCAGDLPPLRDHNQSDTDTLIQQIRVFLDQANLDNEQASNITALMDSICVRSDNENYTISANINVNQYNNTVDGKKNRCKALEQAMNSMYVVFKRSALNKSEPLDFSSIQFYPNATSKSNSYNLTDLINTSWIQSSVVLEQVCKITDSVKDHVRSRASNSTAQDRSTSQQPVGVFGSVFDLIDRILDPILGMQKRLYWESSNTLERVYMGVSNQVGYVTSGIGRGVKNTAKTVGGLFGPGSSGKTDDMNRKNTTVQRNSTVS